MVQDDGFTVEEWPHCGCETRCDSCEAPTGRALLKVQRQTPAVGKKSNPENLRYFLSQLMKFPNVTRACTMAGFRYNTLQYYLKKSENGSAGDGFDLMYGEEIKRFHEHYLEVRDASIQKVEDAYVERAINGYYETLHDKGRVVYQIDPVLDALGFHGTAAYLRDERGNPIPEQIHHQDPEVMLMVLRAWRRDTYGAKAEVDVHHKGGILVVGVRAKDSAEIDRREKAYLAEPVDVPFEEVEE